MFRKTTALAVLAVFALSLTACQSIPEEHRGAAVGAGAGALGGAILGGGSTRGAIVGGLLGALVGGAIGHYAYDQPRSRQQTVETYDYRPDQGTLVRIEDARVQPDRIYPGRNVDLVMTYAVLAPSPDARVGVTERREILHDGRVVGNPQVQVQRIGGTYTSTVPLRLPADAAPGTYRVLFSVSGPSGADTREALFTVR